MESGDYQLVARGPNLAHRFVPSGLGLDLKINLKYLCWTNIYDTEIELSMVWTGVPL